MKSKQQLLQEQNNNFIPNEENNESENINSYVFVEETPFILFKKDERWLILFGNSVASNNDFDTKEEARKYISKKPWDLILISSSIYAEMVEKIKQEQSK